MDNFNNRNFYPDDDWQSISQPIVKSDASEDDTPLEETNQEVKERQHSKHPVLTIQLTVSLCILLFLFIIKFLGTPVYSAIITWYEDEISKSVIYNGEVENFDFSSLLATSDES